MSAKFKYFLIVLLLSSVPSGPKLIKQRKAPAATDWNDVDAAVGRAGQDQPDGTHKYAFPRKDMNVTVNGVQIKAGLALGSWVAFKATSQGNAMAMGDLVLAEDEVAPVMAELQSGGIEITALHNHLIGESPRVMYMHIHGIGNAANLGKAIHSAIAKTKTPDAGATTHRQTSTSIPSRSTRSWAIPAKTMAESIKSACREPSTLLKAAWQFLIPWAWPQRSTSSQQAAATLRSPAILSW